MTDFQAVVLGVLQGATEWLPISSTAHLRIVPALCGWEDPGAAFTAISQLGTFLAAFIYFRRDIWAILRGGKGAEGVGGLADRRLLLPILVGTIPICILGVLFQKAIESSLRSLWVVAGSLIVFAILLALAEARHLARRKMGDVTLTDGLIVGIGQAFALIPGASRSGATITAALFAGLERATAARFSFLLSLPAVFLAGAYELFKIRHVITDSHLGRPVFLATALAFFVGWATIHWLLQFLRTHPTYVFIIYRLVLGLLIIALLGSGRL
jgi:undecaprenyl-diphosphatase